MKIAIVPARGGSKRIHNKNIVDFHGQPIILYTLETLRRSGLFDKIHVSTDCEAIAKVVSQAGYAIDFLREPNLAGDYVGTLPVLQWVLKNFDAMGEKYEDVCMMTATSPLIGLSDIRLAFERYLEKKRERPVMSVTELPVPYQWAHTLEADGTLCPCFPDSLDQRSQDLGRSFYDTGNFVIFHRDHLLKVGQVKQIKFAGYVLRPEVCVDIDTPADLEMARLLYTAVVASDAKRYFKVAESGEQTLP